MQGKENKFAVYIVYFAFGLFTALSGTELKSVKVWHGSTAESTQQGKSNDFYIILKKCLNKT